LTRFRRQFTLLGEEVHDGKKTRPPYPPEFKRQTVELARAGRMRRTPAQIERATKIVEHDPDDRIAALLSTRIRERQSPRVRKALLKSSRLTVLENLCKEANAVEFAELFKQILARSPKCAIRVLKRSGKAQREALGRKDLLPLLASPDPEVRRDAQPLTILLNFST
jgi:hypothetical protein